MILHQLIFVCFILVLLKLNLLQGCIFINDQNESCWQWNFPIVVQPRNESSRAVLIYWGRIFVPFRGADYSRAGVLLGTLHIGLRGVGTIFLALGYTFFGMALFCQFKCTPYVLTSIQVPGYNESIAP